MNISPHQDLRFEPFSRRGSYLSLRRIDEHTVAHGKLRGVYLLQHHGKNLLSPELARVTVDGEDPLSTWDEALLTLSPSTQPGARVDIVFDGTDAIRLRGSGCSLTLTFPVNAASGMYASPHGGWEVNSRQTNSKLQITPLRGETDTDADWLGEQSGKMALTIRPGGDNTWEMAVDQYISTWTPREYPPFESLEAEVRQDFASFLATLPGDAPGLADAKVRAAYVNWSAIVRPCGNFRREAMLMSKNHMCNVWSWDHAFNAMAHMPGDPELAWDQMLLMADRQNEHGAFPDAQNDVHEHFNFCKPPLHGWALGKLRASRPDFFTPARLREALGWLEPWTRWWINHRMWKDSGLPYYLHGNDSGWDNSTFFLKGVPMLTPDLPAFLILQCQELSEVHRLLGQSAEAGRWVRVAENLRTALMETLWDGERFFAVHAPTGERVVADTLIETIPLVLGAELPGDVRTKVVGRLKRYLTDHGLATEHPASPWYKPDGYWRGPIWAPSTLLIHDGLARMGETALAGEIADTYLRLCANAGFAENFDALTGDPLKDKAYTWTSSVFLILLRDQGAG